MFLCGMLTVKRNARGEWVAVEDNQAKRDALDFMLMVVREEIKELTEKKRQIEKMLERLNIT